MSQHRPRLQLARRYAAYLAAKAAVCSALLSVAAWAAAAAAPVAGAGALATRIPSLDNPPALALAGAAPASLAAACSTGASCGNCADRWDGNVISAARAVVGADSLVMGIDSLVMGIDALVVGIDTRKVERAHVLVFV